MGWARQTPLSMGFSRPEYSSGLPCPTPWHLSDPGIEPLSLMSPALAGGFFTTSTTWETLYVEYIMWNARLDESQTGIKLAGGNINNLRYADDTTLKAESEEKLKSLLMKVKEESEKAGLKLNIRMKIMASGPIASWQIDGKTMETVTNFIFSGSKVTADSDCSQEIKRHLLLERKAITSLDGILKRRDTTLLRKVPDSQNHTFSSSHVWMWEFDHKEGWAPKNWCFWIVVLEKTLESPLDGKEIKAVNPKGNQS